MHNLPRKKNRSAMNEVVQIDLEDQHGKFVCLICSCLTHQRSALIGRQMTRVGMNSIVFIGGDLMITLDKSVTGFIVSTVNQRRKDLFRRSTVRNEGNSPKRILRNETSLRLEMSAEGKILSKIQLLSIVIAEGACSLRPFEERIRRGRGGCPQMRSGEPTRIVGDQRNEMTIDVELFEFDFDIFQCVTIVESEEIRLTRCLRSIELRPLGRVEFP